MWKKLDHPGDRILRMTNITATNRLERVCKIAKSDYKLRHVGPSINLSVRMEQMGSHMMDFHKI